MTRQAFEACASSDAGSECKVGVVDEDEQDGADAKAELDEQDHRSEHKDECEPTDLVLDSDEDGMFWDEDAYIAKGADEDEFADEGFARP